MTTLSQRMLDLGTAKSEIREAFALFGKCLLFFGRF